jgi:hypothetical protein
MACKMPQVQNGFRLIPAASYAFGRKSLDFDFYVNTTGQFELHQRVYRFSTAAVDIDQPLVGTQLKLFPRLFINVGRPKYGVDFFVRWQRDGATNDSTRRFNRFHDLLSRFVNQHVVERL